MNKVLFLPFGVVAGIIGGFVAKRAFDGLWQAIDADEPPQSQHQTAGWGKLILASALQGAVFAASKSAFDHGTRRAFFRLTGLWPGEVEAKADSQD